MRTTASLRIWYKRNEKHVASFALIGGFIFDILTLRRPDTLWENSWIVLYIFLSGSIILVLSHRGKKDDSKVDFWLRALLQFSFGGLLSAFLILYFRSATLAVSWPFIAVLAVAFLANERLERYREMLIYQVAFFYLSLLSFAVFFVPVILGRIGPIIFVLSGLVSLVAIKIFAELLEEASGGQYSSSTKGLRTAVVTIFVAMNVMYFAHIIPPIPLSLKDAGVYHSLTRNLEGKYIMQREKRGITDYLQIWEDVHISNGETLYVYTSIFSPANFNLSINHEWQRFDDSKNRWATVSSIPLTIAGGRAEGYRTYSELPVEPGRWRVNAVTENGLVVGRVGFDVKMADESPVLVVEIH